MPHSRVAAPTSLFPESGFSGAGEGNRTPDPLITNQMLYRLSYASRWKQVLSDTILPCPEVRDNYLSYHKEYHPATRSEDRPRANASRVDLRTLYSAE